VSVPEEVEAIATFWAGVEPVVREDRDGTWLFRSRDWDDGFVYRVHRPGSALTLREDNGRPFSAEPRSDWTVVCVNDAPDSWWTVSAEGVYQPWSGPEVKLW
jgi:hypothetical protein